MALKCYLPESQITQQANKSMLVSLWSFNFRTLVINSLKFQLFTLGSALVASACICSLCSVNSGVTLRRVSQTCVTALIFTHQSWAPNWYRPSLITALHCKSFTALCSLFILFCHSAHQKCRSDMSVMVHLNSRAWMTACVAFPLWNPLRDTAGENVLGTTLYHKSWKHSVFAYKHKKIRWNENGSTVALFETVAATQTSAMQRLSSVRL